MSGRAGTGRLLLRYVAALRGVLTLVAALVAVLTLAAAAAPAVLGSLLTDAQRYAIGQMPPASRDLVDEQLRIPPDELVDDDWQGMRDRLAQTRASLPPLLRSITEPGMFTVSTAAPRQVVPSPPGTAHYVPLGLTPDLDQHVRMVEGSPPRPAAGARAATDLVLSQDAAVEMGWRVGEVRVLVGKRASERRYRLSGVYEALDPRGPFWRQTSAGVAPVIVSVGATRTVTATGWVSPQGLDATGIREDNEARLAIWFPTRPQRLTAPEGPQAIDELSEFTRTGVPLAPEQAREVGGSVIVTEPLLASLSTQTTGVLRTTQVTATSLTALTALLAAAPAGAAVCVLVLAIGLVRARSAGLLTLTRARGASSAQVAGAAAVVGLLVGVPGAALGTAAAAAVAPGGSPSWWPGVVCALLPAALAVLAALAATRRTHRSARVPWRTVEVVVVVLAAGAMVSVSQRGLGGPTDDVDPLLVASPILVALAGAVLARRLLPLVASGVAAVQRRRTGLVGLLGASRSREDPVSAAAVVALVAALGAATFAGCAVATLDSGRAETAARAVGADLRVSGALPTGGAVGDLAALEQVRATTTLSGGSDVLVSGATSRTYAARVLTDAEALAEVQAGLPGAVPGVARLATSTDGERPPVMVSPDVASELTGEREVEVGGVPARVVAVGPERLPGVPDGLWVLADREAMGERRPRYDPALSVLASLSAPASSAFVREVEGLFPAATVTTPARESAALGRNPAVGGVEDVATVAAVLAAVLVCATVVLALVAGAGARTRDLAVVRALGLPARRARALPLWEIGLLVVVAGAVGAVVGVVLPMAVLGSIDLRPFTGGVTQPPTTFPTAWWALVAAGVLLVAVAGALLAADRAVRRDLTAALRVMEE